MANISDFIKSIMPVVQQIGQIPQNFNNAATNFIAGPDSTGNGDSNSSTGNGETPMGALMRGHLSDVLPALGRRTNFFATHPENINFGGDMIEPEGAFAGSLPKTPAQIKAMKIAGVEPKINIPTTEPPAQITPLEPNKPINQTQINVGPGGTPEQPSLQLSQTYTGEPSRTHSPMLPTEADRLRGIAPDGKTIQTPNEVAQINATLNGYGIKGSLTDQLQSTSDKIAQLSNQAKSIVTSKGGALPKQDLINLAAKNIVETPGVDIAPSQAINEATKYIDQIYGKVAGVHPNELEGFIAPDQIPGNVAQDMKTLMNQENSSTFTTDPLKWTKGQVVSRPAGDALDRVLDTLYPDASKLNNDMSDLYKAKGSLLKGAQGEIKANQSAEPAPNAIQKILGSPWTKIGLGAVGISQGGNIINEVGKLGGIAGSEYYKFTHQGENNNSTTQTPQSTPDGDTYKVSTPLDDGTLMSEQEYAAKQKALSEKMGAEQLGDPQAYNTDQGLFNANQTEFSTQANLRQVANQTQSVFNIANKAAGAVKSADPSFINALSQGYDAMQNADNGQYAEMAGYLSNLEKLTGIPLHIAKSKDALLRGITAATEAQKNLLQTAKTQYSGSQTEAAPVQVGLPSTPPAFPTSQPVMNWQQNDPQVQAILNAGHQ